jgi:DNA polymerase I-like protein with 3'-5' exonuclease and polymerase domains
VLQLHDELIYEVRAAAPSSASTTGNGDAAAHLRSERGDDRAVRPRAPPERTFKLIRECMEHAANELLKVPLAVKIVSGERWGSMM